MYWVEQVLLIDGAVFDPNTFADWAIAATLSPLPIGPRSLLALFELNENSKGQAAYAAVSAFACDLVYASQSMVVSLLPLAELYAHEQQALRTWLTDRNWPAWARANHLVRSRLGAVEEPVLLSEAAEQTHIPVTTLQSAAVAERLPVFVAADRQLVYVDTVLEAQQRKLLGLGRGRPRRSRAAGS